MKYEILLKENTEIIKLNSQLKRDCDIFKNGTKQSHMNYSYISNKEEETKLNQLILENKQLYEKISIMN